MNLINSLLKTYFYENREKFGEDAVYEGFKQVGGAAPDEKLAFTVVFGAVVHSSGDDAIGSTTPMLAKYVDSKSRSARADGYDVLSRFAVEMCFYRTVLPAFNSLRSAQHLVPELWAAGAATTGASDLAACVFGRADGLAALGGHAFLDYAHLSLMAARIGEFHAYSMAARHANPHYLAQLHRAPTTYERYHLVLPLLDRCLQSLQLDSKYQRPQDRRYVDGVRRLKALVDQFPQRLHQPLAAAGRHDCWVLCHQNYTRANVLCAYDERRRPVELRVCNWQWMGFASLGVDLVVPLFVEASEETRLRCFDRLLRDYYAALTGTFGDVPVPSIERVLDEVKASVPVALYTLASRVLAQSQIAPSSPWWTEERVIDLMKNLIATGFV